MTRHDGSPTAKTQGLPVKQHGGRRPGAGRKSTGMTRKQREMLNRVMRDDFSDLDAGRLLEGDRRRYIQLAKNLRDHLDHPILGKLPTLDGTGFRLYVKTPEGSQVYLDGGKTHTVREWVEWRIALMYRLASVRSLDQNGQWIVNHPWATGREWTGKNVLEGAQATKRTGRKRKTSAKQFDPERYKGFVKLDPTDENPWAQGNEPDDKVHEQTFPIGREGFAFYDHELSMMDKMQTYHDYATAKQWARFMEMSARQREQFLTQSRLDKVVGSHADREAGRKWNRERMAEGDL